MSETRVQRTVALILENDRRRESETARFRDAMCELDKHLLTIRNECQHELIGSQGDPAGGPAMRYCEICGKDM